MGKKLKNFRMLVKLTEIKVDKSLRIEINDMMNRIWWGMMWMLDRNKGWQNFEDGNDMMKWIVKLDVRSNFIYNPDLYNYVIIYIMKISSTLFLYKEVFLSALDMPRSRPSSPTSRPAPNCQYSPDSLCHCIPYFIF